MDIFNISSGYSDVQATSENDLCSWSKILIYGLDTGVAEYFLRIKENSISLAFIRKRQIWTYFSMLIWNLIIHLHFSLNYFKLIQTYHPFFLISKTKIKGQKGLLQQNIYQQIYTLDIHTHIVKIMQVIVAFSTDQCNLFLLIIVLLRPN